jgi:hypothetical protein
VSGGCLKGRLGGSPGQLDRCASGSFRPAAVPCSQRDPGHLRHTVGMPRGEQEPARPELAKDRAQRRQRLAGTALGVGYQRGGPVPFSPERVQGAVLQSAAAKSSRLAFSAAAAPTCASDRASSCARPIQVVPSGGWRPCGATAYGHCVRSAVLWAWENRDRDKIRVSRLGGTCRPYSALMKEIRPCARIPGR